VSPVSKSFLRLIPEEPAFSKMFIAHLGKESRPEPVIAKISQETLAEMVGTTRSRASLFMNKFRKLGLIDYNGDVEGGIEVHCSLLNFVLHDHPQIKT